MHWTSRRTIFKAICGTVLLPLKKSAEWGNARAASLSVERLRPRSSGLLRRTKTSYYRADAAILFLSLPIYRRRGAGGGRAELDHCTEERSQKLCIRFSAGSYPAKARGLNRLGYIEEVIVSGAANVEELAYFGFLTSSPEKDVEEVRRALGETAQPTSPYKVAEGHIREGAETSRKSDLNVAETYSWSQIDQLLPCVRAAFLSDSKAEAGTTACEGSPATFLYSSLSAAWGRENTREATYRYLAKTYRMHVEKKPDPETGRRLFEQGLTEAPETVVELKGTIREIDNGKPARFKLWIENSGRQELPIRFEYKARSFLRVSFERDPSQEPGALAETA